MAGHSQGLPVVHTGASSSWPPVVPVTYTDTYGSASTLSAETTTGSHVFMVADYSRYNVLAAAGWLLQSNTFTVGGCSWRIRYSPYGFCHETEDWICFRLRLQPPAGGGADLGATTVRTSYTLLDQAGQPVPSATKINSVRTLSGMLGSETDTRFMKRERFEAYSYVKDNSFSMRCDVTLVATKCSLSGAMPPPDLRRHLGDLLATGVGADVTLEVGGEVFAVHRSVLAARSPVFKAELLGEREKGDMVTMTSSVRIYDIESTVFKAMLHFIYTDSLPEIDAGDETAMARGLLVAAQRYELEALKQICEDVLGISCPRRAAKQLPSLPDQMRAKVDGCPLPSVTYSEHG